MGFRMYLYPANLSDLSEKGRSRFPAPKDSLNFYLIYRIDYAFRHCIKTGTAGKTDRVLDGDDKVADSVTVRAEVPVVSERHMEEVPVEVLEAPAALEEDKEEVPEAVVVSAVDKEEGRAEVPAGVSEAVVVSAADKEEIPVEVWAVSEEGRAEVLAA